MSDSHGDRPGGVDIGELVAIIDAIKRAFPGITWGVTDALVIAIQLQRNAILNDTAIINGNIVDVLSDLVRSHAITDYIPGEKKH